jgi:hypothetical protein
LIRRFVAKENGVQAIRLGATERRRRTSTETTRMSSGLRGTMRRPPIGPAGFDPSFTAPAFTLVPGEVVYVVPGVPDGVSLTELNALPSGFQSFVMEAWFRANFRPVRVGERGVPKDPAVVIESEFQSAVPQPIRSGLAAALTAEAAAWVDENYATELAVAAQIGTVISAPHLGPAQQLQWRQEISARLDAMERALALVTPSPPGLGHNQPPDGPLSREEHAEVKQAVTELRSEVAASRPNAGIVGRATETLRRVAAAVGSRLLKAAESILTDGIKMAMGAAGYVVWRDLNNLIETLSRWISALGG